MSKHHIASEPDPGAEHRELRTASFRLVRTRLATVVGSEDLSCATRRELIAFGNDPQ